MAFCVIIRDVGEDPLSPALRDIQRLVNFAIGPVNFVLNLPIEQMKCFGEFTLQKNCNQSCYTVIRKFVWASHK